MFALRKRHARGGALIVALISVIMATAMMLAILEISSGNARNTDRMLSREAAFYAATGGVDMVVSDLWGDYLIRRETGSPNFRSLLLERFPGLIDPTPNAAGGGQISFNDNGAFGTTWIGQRIGSATITRIRFTREDRDYNDGYIKNTDLLVEVQATTDSGQSVWASRAITARNPDDYKGFDYAVLTNNITCTVCHLHVQSIAKKNNADSTKIGSFERVKVGTLEQLAIRPGSAESMIEGTLYHRGRFEEEFSGNALNLADLSGSTFKTAKFNENSGVRKSTIYQDDSSTSTPNAVHYESFYDDGADGSTGLWQPKQNLYLNYTTDTQTMANSDGDLPTEFPSPFKDYYPLQADGSPTKNRKIDPDEFDAVAADATGSVGGGIGVNVPAGSTYNAATLPSSGAPIDVSGTHSGNLILIGTADNPIQLNGKIMVQGDVMIQGYVEGSGEIWASGNIYAPGDVIYKNVTENGEEVFGKNASGGANLLGMVAGGNIVIGDYLSQVQHWDSNRSAFYKYGVPEPGDKVSGYSLPDTGSLNGASPNNYNFANFVVEELAFFNRDELTKNLTHVPSSATSSFVNTSNPIVTNSSKYTLSNPKYDPNYVPRYYSFYKDGNVPVYLNDKNYWNSSKQWWNNTGDPHTYATMRNLDQIPSSKQGPQKANAQKLHIHPEWITPGNMLNLILKAEESRPSAPRQIDGLLYTNNAIFAIERKKVQKYSGTWNASTQTFSGGSWSKVNSKSGGRMIVNGAIIAPDLGILVTGGTQTSGSAQDGYNRVKKNGSYTYERKAFTVNYDSRVRKMLDINNSSNTNWGIIRRGWSRNLGAF
ncbi:MAG: hypothetical protein M5U26_28520 [Planctomycetota bacterium]|nr:hypothetical protein [Planctomycetota bacterium]